jgi:hypothetical protein
VRSRNASCTWLRKNRSGLARNSLLGILRENDCWAARLLTERGLTLDWLREELAHPSTVPQTKTAEETVSVRQVVDAWGNGQAADFAGLFTLGGPVCGSSRGLMGWFPTDLGSCKTHLHRAGMGQDCWKNRRCPIRRQQSRHGDPSLGSRRKTGETKSRLRSHDRHSDSETGRLGHRAGASHRSPAAIPLSSCLTLFCGCRY